MGVIDGIDYAVDCIALRLASHFLTLCNTEVA